MISIHYDAQNGIAIPDAGVSSYVDAALETAKEFNPENPELFLTVGCESLIDEFRVRIVRKEITAEQIEFLFIDVAGAKHTIKCNEFGQFITKIPYEFCRNNFNVVHEIVRARTKRSDGVNNVQ
jgi:hypothetical protein